MVKTKTKSLFPALVILLIVSVIFNVVPTSKALNAGFYDIFSESGFSNVRVYWSVSSGPAIDVFILTSSQYSAWLLDTNQYPSTYIAEYLSTSGGDVQKSIAPSDTTYVIFSNVHGGSPVIFSSEGTSWSGGNIVGFEFIMAFFGILALIGITILLRRKSMNSIRGLSNQ